MTLILSFCAPQDINECNLSSCEQIYRNMIGLFDAPVLQGSSSMLTEGAVMV